MSDTATTGLSEPSTNTVENFPQSSATIVSVIPADSPKPGYMTTEFYLTLLYALAPLLAVILHKNVSDQFQTWSEIAAGIATVAYTVSRSIVKHSTIAAQQKINDPVV